MLSISLSSEVFLIYFIFRSKMNSNIPGVNPDSLLPGFTFIVSNISRIQGLDLYVVKYVLFAPDILISVLPRLTLPDGQKKYFITHRTYSLSQPLVSL